MDNVELTTEPTEEEQRVWEWRVHELERLDFQPQDVIYLAASPDDDVISVARKLVERKCPYEIMLRILR